jgi:hypothetical protein
MIDNNMIYVYILLTLFLLVDARLMMLANSTHVRSKGAMQRYQTLRERCGNIPVIAY